MNEIITRKEESAPQLDSVWQRRLDALIRGECSEDDFMEELSNSRLTGADSAWSVVALLDQRYRLGQMPLELFRSIESKIARRELGALDYGTTIELLPAAASLAPADSSPVATRPRRPRPRNSIAFCATGMFSNAGWAAAAWAPSFGRSIAIAAISRRPIDW